MCELVLSLTVVLIRCEQIDHQILIKFCLKFEHSSEETINKINKVLGEGSGADNAKT